MMVAHAHFDRLSKELYRLWTSSVLLDTTIQTIGPAVELHKIILIIFSSYWRDIFSKDKSDSCVKAVGYSDADISSLVEFLYDGESKKTGGPKVMEMIKTLKLDLSVDQKIRKKKKSVSKKDSIESVIEIELKIIRSLTMEMEVPKLLKSMVYSDVKIRTGTHLHNCQKVILAAMSTYFQVMFLSGMREAQDQIIPLQGVETSIFKLILTYIYTGNVLITTENGQELLSTSIYLQISSLQSTCEDYLLHHIDVNNCVDMWKLGNAYNCHCLAEGAHDFVVDSFNKVPPSQLEDIEHHLLLSLVQDEKLNVTDEKQVLDMIMRWLSKEPGKEKYFESLLKCVRLKLLNAEYLKDILKTHSVFKREEQYRSIIDSAIEEIQDQKVTDVFPRKEKVLLVLKSSSYKSGLELACYSFRQQQWYSLKNMPSFSGGTGYACCSSDKKHLYISGGMDTPTGCLQFSVEDNTWSSVPSLKVGRYSHSMESVQGNMYVLGGVRMLCGADPAVSDVEKFDKGDWEIVGRLAIPTSDSASASVKGNIFVIGGTMNATMGMYTKDIQCFNTVTNTCTVLYHHLPMTMSLSVAVTNKKDIYMACPRGEVIHFSDDVVPNVEGHVHRSSMMGYGAVLYDGALLVLGGSSNNSESDVIYKFDLNSRSSSIFKKTKLPFKKQANYIYANVVHISQRFLKTEYK